MLLPEFEKDLLLHLVSHVEVQSSELSTFLKKNSSWMGATALLW